MKEGSYRKGNVAVEKLSKQERNNVSLRNVLGVKSMVEKREGSRQNRSRKFYVYTRRKCK